MIKNFFAYTELRTKITSICSFLLCLSYFLANNKALRLLPCCVFFAGILLFDMCATAINNYIGAKKEGEELPFSKNTAKRIIQILFLMAAGMGLWLVYLTDAFVLLLGCLCFICGIFYTAGPLPISHLPLGEILSGIFYGLLIPWIFFYINLPGEAFMSWNWNWPQAGLQVHLPGLAALLLLSVVPTCCTANIMLANNLCDLEKDARVGRRTLPAYIGKTWGLRLFRFTYLTAYLSIILQVMLGFLPPVALLGSLTVIPVWRNILLFQKEQRKDSSFRYSLLNYLIIMVTNSILFLFAALI